MYPILFRVGSHIVFSYTVSLIVGIALGAWVSYRLAKERFPNPEIVLDAGFWALLGGLLGGRAGYVAANWAYYVDHLGKALNVREGGLNWHGALIGGGAAVALWYVVRAASSREPGPRRPPLPDWRDLLDVLAPGLALGCAFGWLGALLTGSAYGAQASGLVPPLSWLAADLPDIYGVDARRFMTQPLMIGLCLLLFGVLWVLRNRLPRGGSFALYLLAYAGADFAISFLRGDGTWRRGLWLWQWVALAELCAAIATIAYVWTRPDQRLKSSEIS
jgi:phosphatidylglycerol:prolipoprotein diacylglycerol transferase